MRALSVNLVTRGKVTLVYLLLLVSPRLCRRRHGGAHEVVPDAVLQEVRAALQGVTVHCGVLLEEHEHEHEKKKEKDENKDDNN